MTNSIFITPTFLGGKSIKKGLNVLVMPLGIIQGYLQDDVCACIFGQNYPEISTVIMTIVHFGFVKREMCSYCGNLYMEISIKAANSSLLE